MSCPTWSVQLERAVSAVGVLPLACKLISLPATPRSALFVRHSFAKLCQSAVDVLIDLVFIILFRFIQ